MAGYRITTQFDEIDHRTIWQWLRDESYWARGRSWEVYEKGASNSRCFAVLTDEGATAAFARVVTDGATFGWIADVVVLPGHRSQGLGKQLIEAIVTDSELGSMRRLLLGTRDAHRLYSAFGFVSDDTGRFMERLGAEPG